MVNQALAKMIKRRQNKPIPFPVSKKHLSLQETVPTDGNVNLHTILQKKKKIMQISNQCLNLKFTWQTKLLLK